jgi:hypothetical protein
MTKIFTASYNRPCSKCGTRFVVGKTRLVWDSVTRDAWHADPDECVVAPKAEPVHAAFSCGGIVEFIGRAKAKGLKRPAARFLGPANWELRLSLADAKSRNPGSVYVVLADQFIGMIRSDGEVRGEVAGRQDVLDIIAAVAKDPVTAAKAYGALMCRCSFCNLPLTDAGSVEVGYGPICASNYDLPHEPKGTPTLHQVPLS